ncbi:MAG: hypothetical protein MUF54_16070 [Polyangiaceae bacterium]|jgi:hypothetical protein|nr:hypothetical protein [Polyangiaceae bacterium]
MPPPACGSQSLAIEAQLGVRAPQDGVVVRGGLPRLEALLGLEVEVHAPAPALLVDDDALHALVREGVTLAAVERRDILGVDGVEEPVHFGSMCADDARHRAAPSVAEPAKRQRVPAQKRARTANGAGAALAHLRLIEIGSVSEVEHVGFSRACGLLPA